MNIVSVMAHPDDEMLCLGTMLKCQARGDTLSFIILTDGSEGLVPGAPENREAKAKVRNSEFETLSRKVNAQECINLGEHDEFLYDTEDVRMRLTEAIRKTRADVIFTHYYDESNRDHAMTYELVRQCAMIAYLPTLPTESEPLPANPAIFMCEPEGPIDFPATHFVDVTEYHDRKVEILVNSHKSQEAGMQISMKAGFERLCVARTYFRGMQSGCEHAEAFIPAPSRGANKPFAILP